MQRDPRKYLWDARDAADAILKFTRGKTWNDFETDLMLRSAVERQLEIIGEALSQLRKVDPALAGRVHEISRIIGFRNILVHGYAIVDQPTVWRIVQEYLPALRAAVDTLLREAGEPDG